jgi:hypothetical protein
MPFKPAGALGSRSRCAARGARRWDVVHPLQARVIHFPRGTIQALLLKYGDENMTNLALPS